MHWQQIIQNHEDRQAASRVKAQAAVLERPEDASYEPVPFEELFKTREIIDAVEAHFGSIPQKPPKKWGQPEDYATPIPVFDLIEETPEITPVLLNLNTSSTRYTFSAPLIPNHKQYARPNFFERARSQFNNLLSSATASPVAKNIQRSIEDFKPDLDAASKVATYQVAPKIIDALYKAGQVVTNQIASRTPTQKKMITGFGAVFAVAAACSQILPPAQSASTAPADAYETLPNGSVRIPMPAITHCSPRNPMVVETELGTFVETDSVMCRRIMEAVPAPSAFYTQYNENIAVRALQDGSFVFRLVVFKEGTETFDKLLKENPKGTLFGTGKVRQAYADTYRFKINDTDRAVKDTFINVEKYTTAENAKRAGKPYSIQDLELGQADTVQKALKFRQNHQIESIANSPITAENYRAAIGGWLISPLPLHFFLGKWYRESTFNANAQNKAGSARGLNQFTIATFLTIVKKYGNTLGLDDLRDRVMTLSKKHGHNDKLTIHDPAFIKLFREESVNPNYSTAFGVLNTSSKAARMQDRVDAGNLSLPGGRTTLNVTDILLIHYFSDNMEIILNEINKGSTKPLHDVLPPGVYAPNKNDIKNLTAKEFYNKIARESGFGLREVNVRNFFKDDQGRQFAQNFKPVEAVQDIGTRFKIVANENTANQVTTLQARPNVNWIKSQYHGVGVEAIPAAPAVN